MNRILFTSLTIAMILAAWAVRADQQNNSDETTVDFCGTLVKQENIAKAKPDGLTQVLTELVLDPKLEKIFPCRTDGQTVIISIMQPSAGQKLGSSAAIILVP